MHGIKVDVRFVVLGEDVTDVKVAYLSDLMFVKSVNFNLILNVGIQLAEQKCLFVPLLQTKHFCTFIKLFRISFITSYA